MHRKQKSSSGFTLVELLVVIAIIAVLSTLVILYINPAELLKQARDSNRLADMDALKNAISLYLNDAQTPSLGVAGTCYEASAVGTDSSTCATYFATATTVTTSTSLALDSTGWVPVNFNQISSGDPISALPKDPLSTNDASHIYSYIPSPTNTSYKLAATMESKQYGFGGDKDVVSNDNGLSTSTYEVGSALSL